MLLQSSKSQLSGEVMVPSSKSHTVRALVFGLLGKGTSIIRNPLDSGDTRAALEAIRALGAKVKTNPGEWVVEGRGGRIEPAENVVDVQNSGTTLYLIMGVAALAEGCTVFTGDAQIRKRSAENLLNSLAELGATAFSTRPGGCAPLVVGGPLKGGKTTIECPTSQYLTSLLISAPLTRGDTELNIPLLHERPYVRITMDWLQRLGIKYTHNDNLSIFQIPGGQSYPAFKRQIPGDFSSATFFLCAGALAGGEILLQGLDLDDPQGDKAVIDYLRSMGAKITIDDNGLRVYGSELIGADIDLNATPDALPAMAVTACFARGTTRLRNVPQARMKETDRIAVMKQELTALGAQVEELEDGLVIAGGELRGGRVHGHGDHRVAMALCLAGFRSLKPITIDTAESVAITFPTFPEEMAALGADLAVIED
ncbi:MAG: 3-phosphoshikimate 1-carboxyvinyltransferase [Planctomycetes bacterium]|nr:3-phosphoshikimate 1-carboxyvinyltransferase [Planctomycetota bacterium]